METGHVVRFASQKHPFLVETTPCLDLECPCSVMGLTFSELDPSGPAPRERLTFTLQVCLKTWLEQDPPPRSLEVESLVREFLATFPTSRIQELAEEFQEARRVDSRLKTFSLSGSPKELVSYSEVVDERGGIAEGVLGHTFFFVFEGREFLIEDHYCANPACDCQEVHLEFWERTHELYPKRRIKIEQQLLATFKLTGKLQKVRFSGESASTTKHLLRAWCRRGGDQLQECRRRYERIKAVGARSFPPKAEPSGAEAIVRADLKPAPRTDRPARPSDSKRQVRRNDPCPCGSGLKFKRCCARRSATAD
jgi:hypothetical protein